MKAAIFIRDLHDGQHRGRRMHQALYRLTEPMIHPVFFDGCLEREETVRHVIVTAVDWVTSAGRRRYETYILPADESGVLFGDELPGSEEDVFDHEQALNNAGYTIVRSAHELAAFYAVTHSAAE